MKYRLVTYVMLAILVGPSVIAGTTVEWWQFWTDPGIKPAIESMVAEFEQVNPDIDIKLSDLTWADGHAKIVLALASGTGPDVLELGSDWIAQFAAAGHLADITDHAAPQQDQYQGWGMATYGARIYAKPWILGTRVLFCNRGLLAKAGFDTDFAPINWEDLLNAAMRVTSLGDDIYGWGSNTAEKHRLYKKFLPFFWSAGGQIFTDDGKYCVLASERGIGALQFYKQLHDSCGFVSNQRGIEDVFLEGKIGIIISGDWLLKRIDIEKRPIDFFTTLIPGIEFTGRSFLGGEFLAVNAASKKKDAALRFIDFITSAKNQVAFCKANRSANPASVEAQQDTYFKTNPNLQIFIKQIFSANHPPVDPNWVNMETAIEEAVEQALFGSRLVATPLHEAEKKIMKLMQK